MTRAFLFLGVAGPVVAAVGCASCLCAPLPWDSGPVDAGEIDPHTNASDSGATSSFATLTFETRNLVPGWGFYADDDEVRFHVCEFTPSSVIWRSQSVTRDESPRTHVELSPVLYAANCRFFQHHDGELYALVRTSTDQRFQFDYRLFLPDGGQFFLGRCDSTQPPMIVPAWQDDNLVLQVLGPARCYRSCPGEERYFPSLAHTLLNPSTRDERLLCDPTVPQSSRKLSLAWGGRRDYFFSSGEYRFLMVQDGGLSLKDTGFGFDLGLVPTVPQVAWPNTPRVLMYPSPDDDGGRFWMELSPDGGGLLRAATEFEGLRAPLELAPVDGELAILSGALPDGGFEYRLYENDRWIGVARASSLARPLSHRFKGRFLARQVVPLDGGGVGWTVSELQFRPP